MGASEKHDAAYYNPKEGPTTADRTWGDETVEAVAQVHTALRDALGVEG